VGLFDGLLKLFGGGSPSSDTAAKPRPKPKPKAKAKKPPPKPKPTPAKEMALPRIDMQKRFDISMGRLGQGSMSKVFRARDRSTGKMVCLKVLDKSKTAKFEARFTGMGKPKEGIIASLLHHPNIVQTYDYGISFQGEPLIVMELVEGMGLNYLIETKSRSLEGNRIHLLKQLADAVEYMHQLGYLHRDICPRNVMVTNDNVVKLIDFGLTIPHTADYCKPGNRTGTTSFLAPELIRRLQTDHRVDLFALGVTAYNLFTGNLPWERAASIQVLLSHMNSPGRDPMEFCPNMDNSTRRFLVHGIERSPQDRFQTATTFRDALLTLPPR
jgi:serine/threonine protein kinase